MPKNKKPKTILASPDNITIEKMDDGTFKLNASYKATGSQYAYHSKNYTFGDQHSLGSFVVDFFDPHAQPVTFPRIVRD